MKRLYPFIVVLLIVAVAIAGSGPSIKKAEDAVLGRLLSKKYSPSEVDSLLKLPRVRGRDLQIGRFSPGPNLAFSEDYSQVAVMDKTPILDRGAKK